MSIVLAIYLLICGFVLVPAFITFKVLKKFKGRGKHH